MALLSPARGAEPLLLLDPAHGGADPGFRVPTGTESAFVLRTALALEPLLAAAGVPVRLTRRADESPPMASRFLCPGGSEALLVLSLHLNSGPAFRGGARFFYAPGIAASDTAGPEAFRPWGMTAGLSERSRSLGQQLARIAGLLGHRVFALPGASIESAGAPALILELGSVQETSLGGDGPDPTAMAGAWAPFLVQLWGEIKR